MKKDPKLRRGLLLDQSRPSGQRFHRQFLDLPPDRDQFGRLPPPFRSGFDLRKDEWSLPDLKMDRNRLSCPGHPQAIALTSKVICPTWLTMRIQFWVARVRLFEMPQGA